MTTEEQQSIAEEIVSTPINWESDGKGYFLCPMAAAHTTPTKEKHTICYLEGIPTFFCWHQSCKEWMDDASRDLRSKLDFRSPSEKAEAKKLTDERIQLRADAIKLRRELEGIYQSYAWDIFNDPLSAGASFGVFLNFWQLEDIIWIGDVWDTGTQTKDDGTVVCKGKGHFKSRDDWDHVDLDFYHNHFTSGSTYKEGSVDRTQENVQVTKYVVIEFDSLDISPEANKRKGAAILNYLRAAFDLRMVVDSGNKSIHGWFANDQRMTNEAKFFLRQLGADMQTMRPSQPVRLPGGRRENGKVQSILWIA